jgi:histidine triad (HIT) family protein
MISHAPAHYRCPFCAVARAEFSDSFPLSRAEDVIWRSELVTAFICLWRSPRNTGHVLVVPNQHFENLYELPLEFATEIACVSRAVALAFKAVYLCDGVSTRQHNEPSGNQDVWHFHTHIFPRYKNDWLYLTYLFGRNATLSERAVDAARLRVYLEANQSALGLS